LAPPPKRERYGGDWFLCPPNVTLLTLCHTDYICCSLFLRASAILYVFSYVVVTRNSHNWSNDGILLRCVKNTLEQPQNFRNVNIPAPTSGM
jgi:hypothetical protein